MFLTQVLPQETTGELILISESETNRVSSSFLRFAPTRPPTHWSGVFSATSYGSVCPQKFPEISNTTEALASMSRRRLDYLRNIRVRLNKQSEDCLNLNIYAPHSSGNFDAKGIIFKTVSVHPVTVYQTYLSRSGQATSDAVCTRGVLQLGRG